ncbi:hypothetical protein D1AOALGA4SA_7545 [Olavius algarvensis Delta 1 endosymbiont]|nr:hypothetical protein D1AOALGA4SA_7545 [Olavius algarvensis Delta 1 endosymbiont]
MRKIYQRKDFHHQGTIFKFMNISLSSYVAELSALSGWG